ncbi:MAG: 4-alpha-glucanotransferase [Proteobacteria bacterium]|nr:4-alpha-glucanotransferase [Pseudomonadota bacterium]
MTNRSSGVLLHITSLPSIFGVGDLGPAAYGFVDFLERTGQRFWQVLPLNPTDPICANSPYSSASAFAGNACMVSPEMLVKEGLLSESDLAERPRFREGVSEYERAGEYKGSLLCRAYESFRAGGRRVYEFEKFCAEHASWLDDYALFIVIKRRMEGRAWSDWPAELRDREPACLAAAREELAVEVDRERFLQFLFQRQYSALKEYCGTKGVKVIGDIPIYVNYDSADVWSHPVFFKLDRDKRPAAVAGVPPDYFSKTGQLWGNPVYNWDMLEQTGFDWWVKRMSHNLKLFDVARIDHFRGLVAYWEVPASHQTAVGGRWVEVPTDEFFGMLKKRFHELPILAEDLGLITPDVKAAMNRLGFPGMKVLLFAFNEDNPEHPYLPHNYERNCVVYTGTHDNNTSRGWFAGEAQPEERKRFEAYAGRKVSEAAVSGEMIRLAMMSVADTVIIPMQDVLGLGAECRMNQPATVDGNWRWRLTAGQLTDETADYLARITKIYGRAV